MSDTLRAMVWMLGAIVSFSAMAIAGRELGTRFDTFEIMMYRSAVGLMLVLALAGWAGTLGQINRARLGTQLARNLFHFTGQNLWFYAVTLIPLAQLFALEFTTPIWVVLLSPLLLGERLTGLRTLAAGLGFLGVLVVVRPGAMEVNAGVVTALAAAVFFAFTYIFTKRLTRDQSITCIMFYMTAVQLVLGLASAGWDGRITLPDAASAPLLMTVALGGLCAHYSITKALSLAPASTVAPIDFARLPVIAIVGMTVYNEPLNPYIFLGAALIFAGNYLNIWSETRTRR